MNKSNAGASLFNLISRKKFQELARKWHVEATLAIDSSEIKVTLYDAEWALAVTLDTSS